MRIYSDRILSWNGILQATYAASISPNKWLNTYTYKIKQLRPTILHTFSPIEFLEEDRKYYFYNYLLRDKTCEHIPNIIDTIETINNKQVLFYNDYKIYLPFTAIAEDIIILHGDNEPSYSSHECTPILV